MSGEIAIALGWIHSTLTNDATLQSSGYLGIAGRVYNDVGPQGVAYPFITISWAGGNDRLTANAHRVYTWTNWLIKIVDKGSSITRIVPIDKYLDTVLTGNAIE